MRSAIASALLLTALQPNLIRAQSAFPSDSAIRAAASHAIDVSGDIGVVIGLLDASGTRRVIAAGPGSFDGNTLFEIGSITKVFTGILLAEMAERGEVRLEQAVAALLPDSVRVPMRADRRIRLIDLATHSSGLPRLPNNFSPADARNPYADYTVARLYEFLSAHELRRDIGAQYEYSNLGVGLLGHALARRAGMSYEALVTARILAPLGMTATKIELSVDDSAQLARGHGANRQRVSNWDLPTLAGAGALRSTVSDMLTLLAAMLQPPPGPLGEAIRRSVTPHYGVNDNLRIGLNWHITTSRYERNVVWHNGGTAGYRSFAGFDPERRIAVVVLANQSRSVDELGLHLLDQRFPPPIRR